MREWQYCMDKGITDWGKIKTEIKDSLSDFVWKETKRRSDDHANYYGSIKHLKKAAWEHI